MYYYLKYNVFLTGLLSIFFLSNILGQDVSYEEEFKHFLEERIEEFRDTLRSPLRGEAESFEGFHYFPVDSQYRVAAKLELTQDAMPFKMPTSDPKIQKTYVSYGIITFKLLGETHQLRIYRSLRLAQIPMYKDYLFLPFRDQTTGRSTYGGGRYLDLRIPESGDEILIDFNKSYFPNCYYSDGWSCPIPPAENTLDIAIEAGEKLPEHYDYSPSTHNSNQKH